MTAADRTSSSSAGAEVTSDPARIRALAHPIRLALIDALNRVAEATATELAGDVGESVASTSFHLHQLAKYGFVEPAERRGRERPWRLVARSMTQIPDPGVEGSVAAAGALADLVVAREAERVRYALSRMAAGREDAAWVNATTIANAGFWATADELAELREAIVSVVERFADRTLDPARRPEGARHARLFAVVNADPVEAPAERADAAADAHAAAGGAETTDAGAEDGR